MVGRRGMSPLIATIIFMAFAVALGGMIMNWTTSLPQEGIICTDMKLDIKNLCIRDSSIELTMRNIGTEVIGGVVLRVADSDVENTLKLKDSLLGKGVLFQRSIPFPSDMTVSQVSLILQKKIGDEVVDCPEPFFSTTQLEKC